MDSMPTTNTVFAGDFNAHHEAWDVIQREDKWGRLVAKWIAKHGSLLDKDHHPTWLNRERVGRSPKGSDFTCEELGNGI